MKNIYEVNCNKDQAQDVKNCKNIDTYMFLGFNNIDFIYYSYQGKTG